MSSANPPYPYYNGIPYNKNFFSSNTGGLTVGVANTLYLQKTTQDTATAIETFSAGIATTSVDASTSLGALTINGTSTGDLNLGTASLKSGAINIGNGTSATSNISIGSAATNTRIYGNAYVDNLFNNNNNIQISNTSIGNLSIAPLLSSGNIYLGVNSSASTGRTGTIHIGDGNSLPASATIHINNGTSNASNTNINNGATTSGTVNVMTGTK